MKASGEHTSTNSLSKYHNIVAIDEAGRVEPIVDVKKLKVRLPENPNDRFAVMGIVSIQQSDIERCRAAWDELRSDIQQALGLPFLPSIHARLMWGKTLNPYRGANKENYYIRADLDQLEKWIIRALEIIKDMRMLRWRVAWKNIDEFAVSWLHLFDIEEFINDMQYLKQQVGRKVLQRFFSAAASPLLHVLSISVVYLQELFEQDRANTFGIVLDNTSDVAGYHLASPLEKLLSADYSERVGIVGTIGEVGIDYDNFPLMQIADVLSFFYRKMLNGDIHVKHLLTKHLGYLPDAIKKKQPGAQKILLDVKKAERFSFVQRYTMGYYRALSHDRRGEFERLVLTPDEMLERASRHPKAIGFSLLKNPKGAEAWYL